MVMYLVRKTLSWTLVVFLATNLTFFLASSFLDPRSNYQGRRPPLTPEQITSLLEPYNLNPETPILERWWTWLTNILLHWDWGKSPIGESVNEQISYRIWVSAQLLLLATILSIILGIAVGVYTASRQYKLGDRIWQALSIIALNTHIVVVSIVVVAIALKINDLAGTRIFFVTGASSPGVTGFGPKLIDYLQHLALPTISLLIISYASYHITQRTLLLATILSIILGIAVGVYTASRQYKLGDRVWQALSIIALNTHIVVVSIVVVAIALKINDLAGTRIFFVTGASSPGVTGFGPKLIDYLQHLALPTISLLIISYASYHITQRTLLLDNLGADYVRTARAKGLTRTEAIRKHALRTSIIPVATSIAFSVPGIFTGAVMTERIFAWQGMGTYFIETINRNDINGAVAVAAFGAFMTAVGAIISDLVVVALDPRVRVS